MGKRALISNIQKYSIHDGKGIRTTVFLKGCPLSCTWCANPENQRFTNEIMHFENKCVGCLDCMESCRNGAIEVIGSRPAYDREKCALCGKCEENCLYDAVRLAAKPMEAKEVMDICLRDVAFYGESGGVTVSGGECLSFPEFCTEMCELCRQNNIRITFETCGHGKTEALLEYAKAAQRIYFDIKHWDTEKHKKLTGAGNELILHNLSALTEVYGSVVVRIPVIYGVNDSEDDMRKLSECIGSHVGSAGIDYIELLPFHNLGTLKYKALNRDNAFENYTNMSKDDVRRFIPIFEQHGLKCIVE